MEASGERSVSSVAVQGVPSSMHAVAQVSLLPRQFPAHPQAMMRMPVVSAWRYACKFFPCVGVTATMTESPRAASILRDTFLAVPAAARSDRDERPVGLVREHKPE